jgi:two-component system, OmpR family, response regulator
MAHLHALRRTPDLAPTALVADDDPLLAGLVAAALRNAGVRVRVACDAAGALREAGRRPAPDLAILDVDLGGDDGIELARRLRADHPALRAVCISAADLDPLQRLRLGGVPFLRKDATLLPTLRAVLGAGSAPPPAR